VKPKRVLFAAALAGVFVAVPAMGGEVKAVLELFTSQGCSSCPPADKLMQSYATRPDVLALSYPVDYWDYLGWKDTLASHDNSERQRDYAAARGDGEVYTPQMVVNGRVPLVGSNGSAIDAAIAKSSGLEVPINLVSGADATTVNIGAAANPKVARGTIWLVMYDSAVSVPIDRGENSGKTITYSNVVRKLRPIAMWKGEAMSIDLPKSEMHQAKVARCAVLLQTESGDGLPGPIIGAAAISYGR
jgi:hypothetical protein